MNESSKKWQRIKRSLQNWPWALKVFENLTFQVNAQKYSEKEFDKLNPILIGKETSENEKNYFIVGFEDEPKNWDDAVDIIVKTYQTEAKKDIRKRYTIRTEIFCSGVSPKKVRYREETVLDYCGLEPGKKAIIAAVMIEEKKEEKK